MDQQFYNQQPNMQMNQMHQGGQKKKGDGVGFGVASMVLGILSLLFFCTGCNLLFIILAVIFGIIQLVKNEQKGFAITGLVTSGISLVLFMILIISVFASTGSLDYYDYYRDYYDGSGDYDDYDNNYDYDYNDGGDGYDYDYNDGNDYDNGEDGCYSDTPEHNGITEMGCQIEDAAE